MNVAARRGEGSAERERLSALIDGEADAPSLAASCMLWRSDAAARHDWHAWNLIGDVLRSDELASDAGHDAAFLAAFRARLATEPVVLAPAPLRREPGRPARWVVPSAVAAGFALVVGTFAVLRIGSETPPAAAALAQAGSATPRVASAETAVAAAPQVRDAGAIQAVSMTTQEMVRDPQLNRYLAAHKQFAGTSALGVPSAFLRSATLESSSR